MFEQLKAEWLAAGGQEHRHIGDLLWQQIVDEYQQHNHRRTLEIGSGLSTWLFATLPVTHTAIEPSPKWFTACKESPFIQNVDIRLRKPWHIGDLGEFSLILIDGPVGDRSSVIAPVCISAFRGNPGDVILVDDVNRKPDLAVAERIARILNCVMTVHAADSDTNRKFARLEFPGDHYPRQDRAAHPCPMCLGSRNIRLASGGGAAPCPNCD